MSNSLQGSPTKQRILDTAADLFAKKGFTETTVRELTKAIGFKNPASIYHHFQSKNAILEHLLNDYTVLNIDIFESVDIFGIIKRNPTADGIMDCFQTSFPPELMEYNIKILCVLLQEQFRNPMVRSYMSEQIILRTEHNISKIIEALIALKVVRKDVSLDYWTKSFSCIYYSFASRMMLGIGDNAPGFTGMGMAELLKSTFKLILEVFGIDKETEET